MGVLLAPVWVLKSINDWVLAFAKFVAGAALAVMVLFILTQVFFRYVLNNALPWPDEAARFMMLWMTGLAAPAAYRFGGFVAIDMLERALPMRLGAILSLILLSVSLVVMLFAVRIGYSDVVGFAGKFKTASLYLPTSGAFDSWFRIPRSWMMASLVVGLGMLIVVNLELLLRLIIGLMGGEDRLPELVGDKVEAD